MNFELKIMKAWLTVLFVLIICLTSLFSLGQVYTDYVSAGHNNGITVSTSSNSSGTNGNNTVNAKGITLDLAAASRFLTHATLGADYEAIEQAAQMGIENWIENEFTKPLSSFEYIEQDILDTYTAEIIALHGTDTIVHTDSHNFSRAFWQHTITKNDVLRQRVALALSEIFVVSGIGGLLLGDGLACFYDILYNNALGNYRTMIEEITLSPAMGVYLSHINNPKTNNVENIRPDENYAREIMQLFSIGLFELNNDGSHKVDGNGKSIPSYDNNDVKEFAKIFTGLSGGAFTPAFEQSGNTLGFGYNPRHYDMCIPMIMYENEHETGAKILLNGTVVPDGQTGMQDIADALDNLFNHPNVGPFIGKRLIQFLVKSNPSPAYVSRVTGVFNNNGYGLRGDLGAVIKAILMDVEARDCSFQTDVTAGKMREPVIRVTQFNKAFNTTNSRGRYWYRDFYGIGRTLKQAVMHSPSVFNFFQPDFTPNGIIYDNNLVAPEFKILDSNTSINWLNQIDGLINHGGLHVGATPNPDNAVQPYHGPDDDVSYDLSDELNIYNEQGFGPLIDRLDLILCAGQLEASTKNIIENTMNQLVNQINMEPERAVKKCIYFILSSPDYVIIR